MARNFWYLKNGVKTAGLPEDPDNGKEGDSYFNGTLKKWRTYTNGAWKTLGSGESGVFNYVFNPDAADNVDGTATSGGLTIARGTTPATFGYTYFIIETGTTEAVEATWNMDVLQEKDNGRRVSWSALISAPDDTGTYVFDVYDGANQVVGTERTLLMNQVSYLSGEFRLDTSKTYTMRLRRTSGTNDVTFYVNELFIGYAANNIITSPLKETITRTVETVGASSTQLQGGHVLDANSFPSAANSSNTSIWHLVNGSGADALAGARTLTAAGGSVSGATSILGVALEATNFPNAPILRDDSSLAFFNTSTSFTFGGWFKSNGITGTDQLIGKYIATSMGARIIIDSSYIYWQVSANGTTAITPAQIPFAFASQWIHCAIKFDGTTVYAYLNGVVVGSYVTSVFNSTTKFSIGGRGDANDPFNGDADECFYTTLALSDDDIRKLVASKITWTNTLSAANQRLEAEYTYGDFKSQIDSDFIIDKDDDKLYADFSGLPSTAQVSVKMYDAGLSASVIPIRSYDATFLTTPGATIAHGLPSMPTAFAVLHNENADGKWVPLNAENFLRADDTNIYTAGFGALTIDATHPLRIVAAIGQTSAAWAKDFSDNLTPVYKTKTSAYTAVKGDRIFADTSGGAFTITLPPSAAYGDVVEFYDPKDTWDTANVTVARNGHNINGAASDLTLDVEGGFTKLVYFDVTQGWRAY